MRIASFGFTGGRCGVSVHPVDGRVLFGSGQSGTVYDPDTGFEIPPEDFLIEQQTCKINVDNEGYFYLNKGEIEGNRRGLFKFGKEDELPEFFNPQDDSPPPFRFNYVSTPAIAIDRSTDRIFAVETGNKITEYTSVGQPISTFGLAEGPYSGVSGSTGIAVNKNTHDVYVVSKAGGVGRIDVFHPQAPITVPDATTDPAGHPDATSGVLKGTINPAGKKTKQCKFEWARAPST